jgi:hypothetical protein
MQCPPPCFHRHISSPVTVVHLSRKTFSSTTAKCPVGVVARHELGYPQKIQAGILRTWFFFLTSSPLFLSQKPEIVHRIWFNGKSLYEKMALSMWPIWESAHLESVWSHISRTAVGSVGQEAADSDLGEAASCPNWGRKYRHVWKSTGALNPGLFLDFTLGLSWWSGFGWQQNAGTVHFLLLTFSCKQAVTTLPQLQLLGGPGSQCCPAGWWSHSKDKHLWVSKGMKALLAPVSGGKSKWNQTSQTSLFSKVKKQNWTRQNCRGKEREDFSGRVFLMEDYY